MNLALGDTCKTGATVVHRGWLRGGGSLRRVTATRQASRANPPWWLWPHLLSLDAPLVAILWQSWFAHAAGVTLPPSRAVVLGLGVWLIYLADRLADALGSGPGDGASRHVFSGNHGALLRFGGLLILLLLVVYTPLWLSSAEFRAGLCLLALALGYFWLIHGRAAKRWAAYLPKEAVVGGMFSAGSVFFVVYRSARCSATFGIGVAFFAAVCFLNCAFITKWERHVLDLSERTSLLNSFPRFSARLGTASIILAAGALVFSAVATSVLVLPVAASALLLAALDRCENRLSSDALRVLADVVLLTPWLGLMGSPARF